MKSFLKSAVILILLAVAAGAVVIWLGIYNVAADKPHWEATYHVLEWARNRSIAAHSEGIIPPESLKEPEAAEQGVAHYHDTCRHCHGAPGEAPAEFARGLYPRPPELAPGAGLVGLGNGEIFWVVKNGLKMTGMPAFGGHHKDEELWHVVALLEALPEMDPAAYGELVRQAEAAGGHRHGGEDGHGHGEPTGSSADSPGEKTESGDGGDGHDHGTHEH